MAIGSLFCPPDLWMSSLFRLSATRLRLRPCELDALKTIFACPDWHLSTARHPFTTAQREVSIRSLPFYSLFPQYLDG